MTAVKTQTTDGGAATNGTFTLYHADGIGDSDQGPVNCLSAAGGFVSCGLATAWWNGDVGAYVYDLGTLGPGGPQQVAAEGYEEGKRLFVEWIGQTWWTGTSSEDRQQIGGVTVTALQRRYAGVDATPWTVTADWSIALTTSRLTLKREHEPAAGRDASPVYAKEMHATHEWILEEPGSVVVTCGAASLSVAQTWNATLEVYNPVLGPLTNLTLGWYPHTGTANTDYALTTLHWSAVPVSFTGRYKQYPTWRLNGAAEAIALRATSNSDTDAGPYTVGYQWPRMIDFTGFHVRDRQGTDVDNVRIAGPFQASPRVPASLTWSTTP